MNVNRMYMRYENQQFPSVAFTPGFSESIADRKMLVDREYREFLRLMGLEGKNTSSISMGEYCNEYTLFCFNLSMESPELSETSTREPSSVDKGFLQFHCEFARPSNDNFQLWLFPIYASHMRIFTDGVVSLDHIPT